jgi:hypothetical protein
LNEDAKKTVDLHESEWKRDGKKDPFFGPNAGWVAFYVMATLMVAPIAHFLVVSAVSVVWPR